MEGYLYILRCNNGTFYVGSTIDIEKRLSEHQSGLGAEYTRRHLPVELVYVQRFRSIEMAFREECRLHGWSHAKKQALIDGDFELLRKLAAAHTRNQTLRSGLSTALRRGSGTVEKTGNGISKLSEKVAVKK